MQRRLTFCIGCLAIAGALGGCQRGASDPAPAPGLLGTRWALVQVATTPVAASSYSEDYKSYIQFAAGNQALGLAACAAIQARFGLGAAAGQLTISQLTTVKSSCASPYLADRYLAALPQVSRYAISHDTLRLYASPGSQAELVFRAAP